MKYRIHVFEGTEFEVEESNTLGLDRDKEPEEIILYLFGGTLSIKFPDGINPTVKFDSKEGELAVDL